MTYFHSFVCNLFVSLYLIMYVSYKQHRIGFCFLDSEIKSNYFLNLLDDLLHRDSEADVEPLLVCLSKSDNSVECKFPSSFTSNLNFLPDA